MGLTDKLKEYGKKGLISLTLASAGTPKTPAQEATPDNNNHAPIELSNIPVSSNFNINDFLQYQTQRYNEQNITPSRKVDYYTYESTSTGGAYSPKTGTIGLNSSRAYDNNVLAHEIHHFDVQQSWLNLATSNINSMDMTLDQKYKLGCHNEISANIAGLIEERQAYLNAQTPEEKQQVIDSSNGYYSYYFDAVKRGEINPESSSPEDFEKEMAFIAQETQKYWVNKYQSNYMTTHQLKAYGFIQNSLNMNTYVNVFSDHPENNNINRDENYNRAKSACYNIGGIDFSQYLTEDISHSNLPNEASYDNFDALAVKCDLPYEQQANILCQQMFWENAKRQNPELTEQMEKLSGQEKEAVAQKIVTNFKQTLDNDPNFCEEYNNFQASALTELANYYVQYKPQVNTANQQEQTNQTYASDDSKFSNYCSSLVNHALPQDTKELLTKHENFLARAERTADVMARRNIPSKTRLYTTDYQIQPQYNKDQKVAFGMLYDARQPFLVQEYINRQQQQFINRQAEVSNQQQNTSQQQIEVKAVEKKQDEPTNTSQVPNRMDKLNNVTTTNMASHIMALRGLKPNTSATPAPSTNYTQTMSQQQLNNIVSNNRTR